MTWSKTKTVVVGGVFVLAVSVAVFYAEENWRGKHAWENCKRELKAKGAVLDWDKLIPPPVPDDRNFFKAPKMAGWFVKINGSSTKNDLVSRLQSTNTILTGSIGTDTNLISNAATAMEYLAWSDQFQPDFDLIRQALKRPYARMDGDYTRPYAIPVPNFVTVRTVVQTLAQRAHCHLLLNQPEKALAELSLIYDSCRLLEGAPTGKPMTLVSAMINVAVTGLYVGIVAEGLQSHGWREPQLIALQEQFRETDLLPFVHEAYKGEQVAGCHMAESVAFGKLFNFEMVGQSSKAGWWKRIRNLKSCFYGLLPRGWVYQNMVVHARLLQPVIDSFEPVAKVVSPHKINSAMSNLEKTLENPSPFGMLAAIAIPNFTRAASTLGRNQTLVNEGQIACALERFHLAHGEYPETLAALTPQFIEKLPHDIVGGGPLHYRRTEDGKFLLYSIGWNGKDDGGAPGTQSDGDWVWQAAKK